MWRSTARRLGLAALVGLAVAASARAADVTANPWYRAARLAVAEARTRLGPLPRARNVILLIGDGMGIATVTAARIRAGQLRGGSGEEHLLAFETLPFTALAKTYTTDFQVADSAGTVTALLSGVKTRNAVLGVDETVGA